MIRTAALVLAAYVAAVAGGLVLLLVALPLAGLASLVIETLTVPALPLLWLYARGRARKPAPKEQAMPAPPIHHRQGLGEGP